MRIATGKWVCGSTRDGRPGCDRRADRFLPRNSSHCAVKRSCARWRYAGGAFTSMLVAADLVVQPRTRDRRNVEKKDATYRYIQFDVSRFGLPVNHSGTKVIQPSGAVNHVSASHRTANARNNTSHMTQLRRTHMSASSNQNAMHLLHRFCLRGKP